MFYTSASYFAETRFTCWFDQFWISGHKQLILSCGQGKLLHKVTFTVLWANRTFSRQFCAYWKKTPAVSQLLKSCLTAKKATVLKLQRFEEYLSLIQDGGPYMVKFYCAPPWHIHTVYSIYLRILSLQFSVFSFT